MRIVADKTTGLESTAHSLLVILVVILAGLGLAFSTVAMSPVFVLGAVLGLLLIGGFLVRPELALLAVLIGRAASDLSVLVLGTLRAGSGLSLGSLLNIGLALILILGGGLHILAHGAPLLRLPGGGSAGPTPARRYHGDPPGRFSGIQFQPVVASGGRFAISSAPTGWRSPKGRRAKCTTSAREQVWGSERCRHARGHQRCKDCHSAGRFSTQAIRRADVDRGLQQVPKGDRLGARDHFETDAI